MSEIVCVVGFFFFVVWIFCCCSHLSYCAAIFGIGEKGKLSIAWNQHAGVVDTCCCLTEKVRTFYSEVRGFF